MIGVGRVKRTDNYIEPLVQIVLIETDLKILRHCGVGKQHRTPFNVEDTLRCRSRHRSEHTASSTWEIRTTRQTSIGPHVLPWRKHRVVKGANNGWRRQATNVEPARFIHCCEVEATIGVNVDAVEGLIVELEGERQND